MYVKLTQLGEKNPQYSYLHTGSSTSSTVHRWHRYKINVRNIGKRAELESSDLKVI